MEQHIYALSTSGLRAGYGGPEVLHGIDLVVPTGEAVVVLGANGAGKTTLLRTIMGQTRHLGGTVRLGDIDISNLPTHERVAAGLALVPEGRGVFQQLTVIENLQLNAPRAAAFDRMFQLFPILASRRKQRAGTLSGGEQQMLGIARALLRCPQVLLIDEPSLGLAPSMVDRLFETLSEIAATGTTLLLVEQNASVALAVAAYAYVIDHGMVSLSGEAAQIEQDERILGVYLGSDPSERA